MLTDNPLGDPKEYHPGDSLTMGGEEQPKAKEDPVEQKLQAIKNFFSENKELLEAFRANKLVLVVKEIRQMSGLGLIEAKEIAQDLLAGFAPYEPDRSYEQNKIAQLNLDLQYAREEMDRLRRNEDNTLNRLADEEQKNEELAHLLTMAKEDVMIADGRADEEAQHVRNMERVLAYYIKS